MDSSFEQIRDQQRETWNKFSPGWKKWDNFTMQFLRPMGDSIIFSLALKPSDHVLDIATGTGEPGLSIAKIVTRGKVVGTDLAEGMLQTAEANAKAKNIRNYSAQVADVSALPFDDATFDAISCRMGFMFFPDMALAAREMVRVLKPGGRLATSVWNIAPKNPWVTTMMGTIQRTMNPSVPPAGAPGMFRCAQPGIIADLLKNAGLKHVNETEVSGKVTYESADHYWTNMTEVAAPVVAAMSKADEPTRAKIKSEVYTALLAKSPSGPIPLDYSAIIISGQK